MLDLILPIEILSKYPRVRHSSGQKEAASNQLYRSPVFAVSSCPCSFKTFIQMAIRHLCTASTIVV